MAEQKTFWICKCGHSNRKTSRKCENCGKRRVRYILWFSLSFLVVLFLISVIARDPVSTPDSKENIKVEPQIDFIKLHDETRKRFSSANELEKSILAKEMLRRLAKFETVENWKGKIVGINQMGGKGALEIDIGGNIRLFAGEHVMKGISTLINQQNNALFDFVRTVESGKLVTFSGSFPISSATLVEISYTNDGAMKAPKYLFEFSKLKVISN
tara:strand:- start:237 stop:878 length:642 start_codon:yes stop_codon:yes gene_type:complete